MAGLAPPKVRWFNEANTAEVTDWNVGVVDAGMFSRKDDPTIPDDVSYPSTFLIWNNRYDAAANPEGQTTDVADMTDVRITTLSLVRDGSGNIDPNLSYLPEGPVAGKEQAFVQVIFFNGARNGGVGEWGSFDSEGVWKSGALGWREIGGDDRCPIVVAAGTAGTPAKSDTISGKKNAGNLTTDKQNYCKAKMRLYVRPTANAGRCEWLTRISYKYTG